MTLFWPKKLIIEHHQPVQIFCFSLSVSLSDCVFMFMFVHICVYIFGSRSMQEMGCGPWPWPTETCQRMSGKHGQRATGVLTKPLIAERTDWQPLMSR